MSKKRKEEQGAKRGDLRVWWIPQVPMKAFYVPVRDLREARLVLFALANYDLFQLKNNIKPDFANAGGLNVFEPEGEDGWVDWYELETGQDFDEYVEDHPELK